MAKRSAAMPSRRECLIPRTACRRLRFGHATRLHCPPGTRGSGDLVLRAPAVETGNECRYGSAPRRPADAHGRQMSVRDVWSIR